MTCAPVSPGSSRFREASEAEGESGCPVVVVGLFWSLGRKGVGAQHPDLCLQPWNLEHGTGQREPSL